MSAPKVCECCGQPIVKADEAVITQAKLSPSERAFFRAVARGKGREVSLSAIHDAIWGANPNGGPDAADGIMRRHASIVRSKVAPFGFGIVAVYGIGYRLIELEVAA